MTLIFLSAMFGFVFSVEAIASPQQTTQIPIIQDSTAIADETAAIPLSSVVSEAQKTNSKIQDIKTRIEGVALDVNLDSLLKVLESDFKELEAQAKKDTLKGTNLNDIEDTYRGLSKNKTKLQNLKNKVIGGYNALQPDLELTVQMQKRWKNTKDNLSNDAPSQIKERIRTVSKDINDLNKEITDKQYHFLVQEDQVTTMIMSVDGVQTIMSNKMLNSQEQYFSKNDPSFWAMFKGDGDTLRISERAKINFEAQKNEVQSFYDNYRKNIGNQLLFLLVLYILLLILKIQVKGWSFDRNDELIQTALQVINRPLIVAITISVLVTPFNFSQAPQVAMNLLYVLALVPIFFLIPKVIPFVKKHYFYLFGLLFLLNEVALFFERYYIINRVFLLFFDLVAITILLWALLPKQGLIAVFRSKKMGTPIVLLRLSIFLFAVGIISNLFGYTSLSYLLSYGGFDLCFAGILIYAVTVVLKSLVKFLMVSPLRKVLHVLQDYSKEITRWLSRMIDIAAVIYFIIVEAKQFLIYDAMMKWITDALTKKWGLGEVKIELGSILAFFLIIWLTFFLAKVITTLLQEDVFVRFNMKRGAGGAISMMVRIVLITMGLVLACSAVGITLSNLTILFGALGVGIGFGLQNIVMNFISGLIIAFERPIQKGDVAQIGKLNLMGTVQDIGMRSSTIKTYDGADVIVPNGNIISNEIINWTLTSKDRRKEIRVGVQYGTDVNSVLKLLNETVANNKDVHNAPAPWITFTGFGDSTLNFRVCFWTTVDDGATVVSKVGADIDEAFKKAGIVIPFPQRDLHIINAKDSEVQK